MLGQPASALNRVRGAGLSMIFQDPLTSLTPHLRIGDQIAETLVQHTGASWKSAREKALTLLERVHVTDPARRLMQYPHELSGGMRQRVMIAIALACGPKLVIADEPTTALDVTIQAQILALLAELKREQQMAMVLITHDLGIVAGIADRVAVMQAGSVVELGTAQRILKHPEHAYTQSLLHAVPRLDGPARVPTVSLETERLLALEDLRVQFRVRAGWLRRAPVMRALEDINLVVWPGEVVGIVGESGSGKVDAGARGVALTAAGHGSGRVAGQAARGVCRARVRAARRDTQLVFQDPIASLDPRMTVAEIVAEPLRVHRGDLNADARTQAVADMLLRVGLGRNLLARHPHELSGGQAQRVAIARAMVLKPKLLVCDEAVSALDVSVQAQILALLLDLKRESRTAILFISHNLAVVRQLCDRVLVLYLGRMMEEGGDASCIGRPPIRIREGCWTPCRCPILTFSRGGWPGPWVGSCRRPSAPPSGCVFRTRCPDAHARCAASACLPPGRPDGCQRTSWPATAGARSRASCEARSDAGAGTDWLSSPPMTTEPTLRPSDSLRNVRYEIRGKLARRAHEMRAPGLRDHLAEHRQPGRVRFPHAGDHAPGDDREPRRRRRLLPPEGHLPGARSRGDAAAGARRARA